MKRNKHCQEQATAGSYRVHCHFIRVLHTHNFFSSSSSLSSSTSCYFLQFLQRLCLVCVAQWTTVADFWGLLVSFAVILHLIRCCCCCSVLMMLVAQHFVFFRCSVHTNFSCGSFVSLISNVVHSTVWPIEQSPTPFVALIAPECK